jgi:hypothetical protein
MLHPHGQELAGALLFGGSFKGHGAAKNLKA